MSKEEDPGSEDEDDASLAHESRTKATIEYKFASVIIITAAMCLSLCVENDG